MQSLAEEKSNPDVYKRAFHTALLTVPLLKRPMEEKHQPSQLNL